MMIAVPRGVLICLAGPRELGLLGISLAGVTNTVLDAFTRWVALGSSAFVDAFSHVLGATTSVSFGTGFDVEFEMLRTAGLELVAPLLFLVIIQAIVRQDLDLLWRTVAVRLPLALLLSSVAVESVAICIGATDSISSDLLRAAGVPAQSFLQALTVTLVITGGPGAVLVGFEGLFLAALTGVVAFACWLELVVRAAAITVATMFIPIALAGLVWPSTAHWARRLGETIGALVISKLVIAAVFALAAVTLGGATGVNDVVTGIALFILASLAPFSILRLLPMVEAGAVGHFESLVSRAGHGARAAVSSVEPLLSDLAGPAAVAGSQTVDDVGLFPGDPQRAAEVAQYFSGSAGTGDDFAGFVAPEVEQSTGSPAPRSSTDARLGVDPSGASGSDRGGGDADDGDERLSEFDRP